MYTRLLLPALFLTFSAGLLLADLTVVQEVEQSGAKSQMTTKIKGDMTRVDPSSAMSVILNAKTGDTINLMHGNKTYMKISGEQVNASVNQLLALQQQLGQQHPEQAETIKEAKLEATGRTQEVSGYKTEEYVSKKGSETVSLWIAKDFPDYKNVVNQLQSMEKGALAKLTKGKSPVPDAEDLPGMPILVEAKGAGGTLSTWRLVSVSKDPIDASEFRPPADYTEFKMPELPKGLKLPGMP